MEQTKYGKKILLATILTGGLALVISQAALAQPESGPRGSGAKSGPAFSQQVDPAVEKANEAFLAATVAERKELAQKTAALRALMNSDNQNTTQVAQLAGEVFELREKLQMKAQEVGHPMHMMMGAGDGMGMAMGPCGGFPRNRGHHHRW